MSTRRVRVEVEIALIVRKLAEAYFIRSAVPVAARIEKLTANDELTVAAVGDHGPV